MFSNYLLLCGLALSPLSTIVSGQNVTLSDVSLVPCPFKIEVTPSPAFGSNGSYFDITYSTKGTNPNSLVSYGTSQSTAQRRCYATAKINHPNLYARARPLWLEMSGNVKLDAGLTAKVETGLVWANMMAMTNFTTLTFTGPTSSSSSEFTRHLNVTNRSHAASCEWSQCDIYASDIPSHAKCTLPHLISTFSISGTGDGVGTLGEDSELKHRLYVEWCEGCGSYSEDGYFDCAVYDRFDRLFRFAEREGRPPCVDWSKPPPGS